MNFSRAKRGEGEGREEESYGEITRKERKQRRKQWLQKANLKTSSRGSGRGKERADPANLDEEGGNVPREEPSNSVSATESPEARILDKKREYERKGTREESLRIKLLVKTFKLEEVMAGLPGVSARGRNSAHRITQKIPQSIRSGSSRGVLGLACSIKIFQKLPSLY